MSVTTETTRLAFVGDGNDNSPYAISFPLRDDDSVEVIYVTDSTGAEVVKTKTTDYTIALAADFVTANLTLVTTAPATGETMVIRRSEPATRLSSYSDFDGMPSGTLNSDYDKGTMQDLTLQEQMDRSILVSKGHPNASLPLSPLTLKGNGTFIIAVKSDETDFELLENAILDGTISPAKLLDGGADNQVIQFNSGLGEWEYRINLTLPGTLAVTGASTLTGDVTVSDGTEAAPGLRLTSEAHGLYRISGVALGISIAGTKILTVASTGISAIGTLDSTGNISVTNNSASTAIQVQISNNDTNAASTAKVLIRTGVAGAADPSLAWSIQSGQGYSMGIDNSDSDKLVLSRGLTLGTTNVMEITTAGAVTFKGALAITGALTGVTTLTTSSTAVFSGNITVPDGSEAAPGIRLTTQATGLYHAASGILGFSIDGTERARLISTGQFACKLLLATGSLAGLDVTSQVTNSDNTNAASDSRFVVTTGGSSGGDPYILWDVASAQDYVMGIDNSDSDKLVISRGTAIGTTNVLEITTAGAATFNGDLGIGVAPSVRLHVSDGTSGDIAFFQNTAVNFKIGGTSNVAYIDTGTGDAMDIRTVGVDAIQIDISQNVVIPAGDLTVSLGDGIITAGNLVVGASAIVSNAAAGDIQAEGGSLIVKEITTPTADANYGKYYTKADNKAYFQDGAGAEHEIAFV